VLQHDRRRRQRSDQVGELGRGEAGGRPGAAHRQAEPLGRPPDRERIVARRPRLRPQADAGRAALGPVGQPGRRVRAIGVDEHDRGEATRVSAQALHLVGAVELAADLHENGPLDAVAVHLVQQALDRREPGLRDVAVAVADHRDDQPFTPVNTIPWMKYF
jgi:hypothetical protein